MSEPTPNDEALRARSIEIKIPKDHIGVASREKEGKALIEDAFSRIPERGRGGVFDGLGKIDGAAKASQAAKASVELLSGLTEPATTKENAITQISQLLQLTNITVRDRKDCGQTTGTIVQLIEVNGQKKVIIGNVGDSRAYLLDSDLALERDPHLTQLTNDDNWIHEVLPLDQANQLSRKFSAIEKPEEFSQEPITFKEPVPNFPVWNEKTQQYDREYRTQATEKEFFSLRSKVLKSLGQPVDPSKPFAPTITESDVESGNLVIVTSDGIHDNLTDEEIRIVTKRYSKDPQLAADELVKLARKRSQNHPLRSKPDDMTALVIKIP